MKAEIDISARSSTLNYIWKTWINVLTWELVRFKPHRKFTKNNEKENNLESFQSKTKPSGNNNWNLEPWNTKKKCYKTLWIPRLTERLLGLKSMTAQPNIKCFSVNLNSFIIFSDQKNMKFFLYFIFVWGTKMDSDIDNLYILFAFYSSWNEITSLGA